MTVATVYRTSYVHARRYRATVIRTYPTLCAAIAALDPFQQGAP